jgi:hexokinase
MDIPIEKDDKILVVLNDQVGTLLTVYFGTPNMFITLWFGFVYGTNPPLGSQTI